MRFKFFVSPVTPVHDLATQAFCLFMLFSGGAFAQECPDPLSQTITRVSSATVIETDSKKLIVLYGVESLPPSSPSASKAREFSERHILDPETCIQVHSTRFGIQYVKVTLNDGRDLSELLLKEGLVSWDKIVWSDLTHLGEIEKQREREATNKRSAELAERAAQSIEFDKRMAQRETEREQLRQQRDWEDQVRRWRDMTPAQRLAVRADLEVRREALDEKIKKAGKYYNLIVASNEVLGYAVGLRGELEDSYRILKKYAGPNISLEFQIREIQDDQARAAQEVNKMVAEYNGLVREIEIGYPALEAEVNRVAALDESLPADLKIAESDNTIRVRSQESDSAADLSGTGFVVATDVVLTCAHITDGARTITVRTLDGTVLPATPIADDSNNDWCLLQVPQLDKPAIPFAAESPKVGEPIYCLGYPLGSLMESKEPVAGSGNVAATSGVRGDSRHLQITAPINEGNSGSPIFDKHGHWVGLASHKINDLTALAVIGSVPQGLNFAVKASYIEALVMQETDVKFFGEDSKQEQTLRDVVERYSKSIVVVLADN